VRDQAKQPIDGGPPAYLDARNLHVFYGKIEALHGISLKVGRDQIVTLIGANGAGKSTTLRAISGVLAAAQGDVVFDGERINDLPAHKVVSKGVIQIPEGRRVFGRLSVAENLKAGAFLRNDKDGIKQTEEQVLVMFPRLKERYNQTAGTLSGGEQQMLAMGRALMSKPKILLMDEPSMGLAPILVEQIFDTIVEIRKQGVAVLLVEQNAFLALQIADYGYVIETGEIVLEGPGKDLLGNDKVKEAYLG
jgi:branched-chain amino acid transport system ATP-binding protein